MELGGADTGWGAAVARTCMSENLREGGQVRVNFREGNRNHDQQNHLK